MQLSTITKSISITSQDLVYVSDDLKISPISKSSDKTRKEAGKEQCQRVHFELTERVEYLGIAKEIPVVGWIAMSEHRKVHIEHRSASNGLVVTDKVRLFKDLTSALPNKIGNDNQDGHLADSALDGLVVDEDSSISSTLVGESEGESARISTASNGPDDVGQVTEIHETLHGVTSWYLKFFTEMEARKSHLAIMEQYDQYISKSIGGK